MTQQTVTDAQIAEAAFYIWLEEGQPEGRDLDHWVKARTTLESAMDAPKKRAPRAKAAAKTKAADAPKAKAPRKAAASKAAVN